MSFCLPPSPVRESIVRSVTRCVKSVLVVISVLLLCSTQALASISGLVVSGIGGTDEYEEQFAQNSQSIVDALRSNADADSDFMLLQGADATREAIIDAVQVLAERDTDAFYLVLLGHGTIDSETWRFNVPGPDVTTNDLVASLARVQSPQQLVVVSTSASGAVLDVLSQPGRYVVTATKSAGELNVVRFGDFLSEAMDSAVADVDRNEILTLAEAFRYANEKTQNYYTDQNLLASEHARLSGDEPERIALARLGALRNAKDNPAVQALLQDRLLLEDAFIALKARKPEMETAIYYADLETLLVSIARLQQKIDLATGWVETNE